MRTEDLVMDLVMYDIHRTSHRVWVVAVTIDWLIWCFWSYRATRLEEGANATDWKHSDLTHLDLFLRCSGRNSPGDSNSTCVAKPWSGLESFSMIYLSFKFKVKTNPSWKCRWSSFLKRSLPMAVDGSREWFFITASVLTNYYCQSVKAFTRVYIRIHSE